MEKYSQIVEEEEEDAYQEEEEELYEENENESEDDELQFIQEPMKLHQFLNEENQLKEETDNQSYINCVEDYDQNELQDCQSVKSLDKSQKNSQIKNNPTQIHRQKTLKPINNNNEDNIKTYKSQFAKQSSFNQINQTKATPNSQNSNNKITDDIGFKRPKTANCIQISKKLIPEMHHYQQPKYIINKTNVPKETYYAYRSLSPTKIENKEKSSQLNVTSPQFLFTAIQSSSSLHLQKLAQAGLLDASSIQQIDEQKQNILEIDKKVLFLNNKSDNKIKQQSQTLQNFYKKDISNHLISNFQAKFTTSKISHHAKFKIERSSSHSPSKQIKKQHLPHRLIQVAQLSDGLNHPNVLADNDKNQKKQLEIEKSASPASKIEEKYMKAMKSIEKAYEIHDLVPKKNDISFNNQYFTIIRYTQQLKTPIDILDQDFIDCSMYALSYNAYFIPTIKRQLPYFLELCLQSGEVEVYVSKSENPNLENNDFLFMNFEIPIKLNYQKNEIKEGIYLNIFCRKQSTFRFRVVSELNSAKMLNGISMVNRMPLYKNESYRKNYFTTEYKNQLVLDKASHYEQKLKFERNMNFLVVEQSAEEQNKQDNFLKIRFKNNTQKNIIEQNKEGVRKYSPNERKEHLNKQKEEKQVKIVRAQYIKNLQKYQELSQDILKIQRKAERKQQLIDSDGRLESEVRLLKQCFQYRWLQLFVLIQIVKVFSYFIKAYRVKEARNLNLTNPMISLNRLMNSYLCKKLGKTKEERTFSRVYYCLKTRVKAFKKLMKHNAQLVAGEYMKQKIKIMIIQSKMMVYYKHIVTIQRSYRNLLQIRDVMNEVNIKHWDIAFKSMLDDEQKFFDKSWIAKLVLVDYKRRIEKNKVKTLAHFVKGVQSQYFSKLKQYQTKLKKLPYSYQIAYQFCGKAFKSYFEKQYAKQINEGFQLGIKKTTEYLIEALKFMVKHNIYQIVNNPIIAYEKEKQKQLEAQKKKNIENLRQKELQLQKQREEEYLLQKSQQRNPKKSALISNQDNDSGQSSSSQESIEDGQKNDQSIKKDNKLKQKKPQNEQNPISFQDYLQIEEKKIEENNARRVSKVKINTQFGKTDAQKNLELQTSSKKSLHIAQKIANSSLNIINIEEITGADEVDSTPRHVQANSKNHATIKHFTKNFHDESNSQKSSGFKKQKLSILHKQDQSHLDIQNNENKNSILKKHNKKQVKKNQDIEEKEENDNEDVEEEDEYDENENSNDEGENCVNSMSAIKRSNQKKQSVYSQNQNSKEEEDDDEEQNSKVVFELTGQQQVNSIKKIETKQQSQKGALKSYVSSSGSQQSIQSQSQISNSNVSSSSNLNTQNNLSLTKQQVSQAELQSSQFYQIKEQQNSSALQAGLAASRSNKNQKQKKKKQKKKKIETKEQNKLEEIKEGDEAIQTFWANFIHYPIFTSFPNITEMKELIIKLLKKL